MDKIKETLEVVSSERNPSLTVVNRETTLASAGLMQTSDIAIDGVLSLGAAVIAALLFFRRKFHQDTTEIRKGEAESKLIETLIKQAETYKEDARVAWGQRTRDAEMIARQQSEILHMMETIRRMQSVLREVAPHRTDLFDALPPPDGHSRKRN